MILGGRIMNELVRALGQEQLKKEVPNFGPGDTVKVHVKIVEGKRERIQVFEGIIIKIQGGGVNQTFTVRRISYGVGVEKTFLVHSPMVEKVEVVRVGKARRARLFYLRDRVGKSAKTKEQVGARIETLETIIKEEAVEAPVEEVAETVEAPVENAEPAVEAAPEEAPAVETTEVVKEEVVDTVSEEKTETAKEATEEVKSEE